MTRFLGLFIVMVLCALPCAAQPWLRLHSPAWIAVPNTSAHDYGVYYFRKDITLTSPPSSFPVDVSGDNRYKLYVNGKIVSLGPARSDILNWNYEHLDIAPYLQEGKNVLAAVVWNDGAMKPEANMSYRTGFFMRGTNEVSKAANTDTTWLCIQDKAYQPLAQQVYGYYAAGPGESINFNNTVRLWQTNAANLSIWKKAQMICEYYPHGASGAFGSYMGWNMKVSSLPQMELTLQRLQLVKSAKGIKVPKYFLQGKSELTIPAHSQVEIVLDQQHLTNAYFSLNMSKGKNAQISIGYAESFYEKGDVKGNRNEIEGKQFVGRKDSLIANGEEQQLFTTLAWRTYRYVLLKVKTEDEALNIKDIYGTFTGFPFHLKAQLSTSDKTLQQIFDTGWRTARLCAMETYMDCPYYEQLQYFGDARIQALVSLYNTGDDRLVKNYLNQAEMSFTPEGIAQSRYPSTLPQYIHPYSLHYIYALHDYMMYGKDMEFLKDKLRSMRNILDYFHHYQQQDGRVINLPSWNFSDWVYAHENWNAGVALPGKDGCNAVMDMQLLYAYVMAADIENKLGMHDFANLYQERANLLKSTVIAKYWSKDKGLFADVADGREIFSQHANALAILANAVTDSTALSMAEKLETDKELAPASIYFKYYLHQAMSKAGLGGHYLAWLDKWKENLRLGLTTWAETSEVESSRSDCHAWGASPNIELLRTVLGIGSDAPGFRHVVIRPHLGKITKIGGTMPHPKGVIHVNYDFGKKKSQASIELPIGVTGTFWWNDKSYELHEGNNDIECK